MKYRTGEDDGFRPYAFMMFIEYTHKYYQNKECMFLELKAGNVDVFDDIKLRCTKWYWEEAPFVRDLLNIETTL